MKRIKLLFLGVVTFTTSNILAQATASDCPDHVNICSDASFQVDPNGYGNVDELGDGFFTGLVSNPSTNPGVNGNSGCLLSGELNSTWMVVTVSSAGALEFSFGADGGTNCYDWIMWQWDPNVTCNAIVNDTWPPVACNWNGWCEGFTGMANTLPAGADPSNFEASLNVQPGDQFIICLSNYSSATTSVPLTFYQNPGSAGVSCTPIYVNDETICEGECTTLTANGGSNYSWSPTTGLTPTTGAVVTACPPSAGTWNYFVSGTTPDGPAGDTATVIVLPFSNPACSTPCNMTNFTVNTGPCDPGSTNTVDGTVQYSSAPSTGQLIVEDCQGNQQVFNPPFGTQQNFSFVAQADGSTCAVTAYFTADPSCTISVNATYQPPCGCTVDAGTFTVTVDGTPVGNNEVLCFGETIDIETNNDFIAPPLANAPPISAPGSYNPGIGYLLFSCPPTTMPPGQIELDPCFLGVLGYGSFTDPNALGQASYGGPWTGVDETMYIIPITFYDVGSGTYSYVNTSTACWDIGPTISVQYLSEIT
ncbi:MAG: hypothetical protein KDC84_13955, partial [Crocinitomicaceae bacterium]|nr:hypothetical protein [Crocinitomicaceae bacterium]